ncbi:MAG: GNAT family N-acetyltransferase [Methanolinea sp.]|nr:GNAT family N-acetyltransferase [Methanolinea sp.]
MEEVDRLHGTRVHVPLSCGYPKVLVPTDLSCYSRMTAAIVPLVPGVRQVVFIHVTPKVKEFTSGGPAGEVYQPDDTLAGALTREAREAREARLAVSYEIVPPGREGVPAELLKAAERHGVDLVLIGARGRGLIGDLLPGHVSEKVLEGAGTDVLLTRFPAGRETSPSSGLFSRILVPVDFGPPSLELAGRIVGMESVQEVIILHVITQVADSRDLHQKLDAVSAALTSLARDLDSGDCLVTPLIRFGNAAGEICRVAEEEGATMIAIPRHGARDYASNVPIGSTASGVARNARLPVLVHVPGIRLSVIVRELEPREFELAEEVWRNYQGQKADPATDRIFGVFVEGRLVSVGRCRQHPDGREVDSIFTLEDFRRRGYARDLVGLLVRECGHDPLYLHSTRELVDFYGEYGFFPVAEEDLPPSIRQRFDFAMGNLPAIDLQPMKRP